MKMKKTFVTALAVTTLGAIGVGSAYATEVDKGDTEVGIGFVDAHIPGENDGDLQLRWVPKKLDFGKYNDVNSKYTEFSEASTNNYYVVVRDTRKDDQTGTVNDTNTWKVNAKLGEIVATGQPTKKLTKAQLFFDSKAHGYEGENDPNTDATTIKAAAGHAAAKNSTVPTVNAKTQLEAGGATKELMRQTDQKNSSDWAASLENIKLGVGGKQSEKGYYYSGTLTWTLDDTL
ncbi:WxL domain-containing protein [Candidatus Enterococcus murrayae]|uniref:WxL domain-containing protein n=1 Tax=Candidatus Enterococcus murrayae TaxID=2815321 RepID=A0ABS3HMT3_9ENTE|nr:WxL domain-containing protein [Enterococcus sp. MJM16]MBO0454756.1 WxL domain-containing protein [Enterococcus sp. MJM16]